jgi:hypothetical protein
MGSWRSLEKISWTDGVKKRKHYKVSRSRGTFYTKWNKGRLTGHIMHRYCFPKQVLKERYNRWEDEEEEASIQWMP